MPKLKTRKALLRRIKVTGRKKIMARKIHQGHFNAKESGNQTRGKRRDSRISPADTRKIKKILPGLL